MKISYTAADNTIHVSIDGEEGTGLELSKLLSYIGTRAINSLISFSRATGLDVPEFQFNTVDQTFVGITRDILSNQADLFLKKSTEDIADKETLMILPVNQIGSLYGLETPERSLMEICFKDCNIDTLDICTDFTYYMGLSDIKLTFMNCEIYNLNLIDIQLELDYDTSITCDLQNTEITNFDFKLRDRVGDKREHRSRVAINLHDSRATFISDSVREWSGEHISKVILNAPSEFIEAALAIDKNIKSKELVVNNDNNFVYNTSILESIASFSGVHNQLDEALYNKYEALLPRVAVACMGNSILRHVNRTYNYYEEIKPGVYNFIYPKEAQIVYISGDVTFLNKSILKSVQVVKDKKNIAGVDPELINRF